MTKDQVLQQAPVQQQPDEVSVTGSKRTRRQTKITDAFSLTRKSRQTPLAKEDVESTSVTTTPQPRRTKTVPGTVAGGLVMGKDEILPSEITDEETKSALEQTFNDETISPSIKAKEVLATKVAPKEPVSIKAPTKELEVASKTVESVIPFNVREPAYLKYSHLLSQSTVNSGTLPFPKSFSILEKLLTALDGLCMLAGGRDQPVIIHRVLKSLAASIGHRIEMDMITTLEKVFDSDKLAPSPRILYSKRPVKAVLDGRRIDSFIYEIAGKSDHDTLADRRLELTKRLACALHAKHDEFLSESKIKLPEGAKLVKWHPKFDLEAVGEAILAEHREPTTIALAIPESTPDVIKEAIEASSPTNPAPSTTWGKVEEKKMSVLERIKAKELQASLAKMTKNPELEKKQLKYRNALDFIPAISQ